MAKFKFSALNNKHILSLTGNGIMSVFATGLAALLTRSLTLADMGVWVFFGTVCALAEAVRSGLLTTATIKFYGGASPERGREVLGSVWFLGLWVTGIFVLLDVLCMPFIHAIPQKELVVSIRWFGITFISSLPFTAMYWILQADERYGKVLLLRFINSFPMLLYVAVLILIKKMSLEALLWSNFLTNCFASIAGLIWGFGKVRTFFHRSRQCIMEITHFGKYSLGSTFVSKLLSSTDTFMISAMLGNEMLAVYYVATTLMQVMETILRSFVATGISGMAIAYNKSDMHQVGYIMQKYSGMLVMAFIPMAFLGLIFGDLAISLLAGGKYVGTEAANILRIFMFLAILYPIDRFTGITLDVIHKPRINLYKVIVMLAFAIVGDYTGILLFKNLYGVAAASFLVTLSGIFFGYFYIYKYLKVPFSGIFTLGFSEMVVLVRKTLGKGKEPRLF